MTQLTMLDAGFLKAEDSDRHVSLAIGVVAILEGPPPSLERLKSVLLERLCSIPRCTQVLRTYPFDIEAPQWITDAHFDIAHHVRRIALPRPGGDAELFGAIAQAVERRLDRDRPLWEFWVIEGLQGNRWAIVMKIHHCMVDGISGTHILTKLCDKPNADAQAQTTSGPGDTTTLRTVRTPRTSVFNRAPFSWANTVWRTSNAVTQVATRAVAGAAELATGLLQPARQTSLTGPLSTMRRYTAVRVRLPAVLSVCRKFDVTVNDVALAAITEAFRAVLLHRGEQPRADSLRTLVPVSMRSADAVDKYDNRFSVMLPYLPVELDDPVQRLQAVHNRLTRAKQSGQREAGNIVTSVANSLPFVLSAWVIRLLTRLPQRGIVTLATNVPGPRYRLRLMGRAVERLLPIPPIALHLRTGVAVLSYADDLIFGITADYDTAPDLEELAAGIELGVARLEALSRESVLLFAR
ncbi:MAG: wax ester/triacylglycerol synthase family O-acyltransferase [Mycobacteriaceae bacterium]|nr:wax ester/triacylglycerol synthase family O-acyltransferase [Mycobacteriaceae bacterium]